MHESQFTGIEWDDEKSKAIADSRGLDFFVASRVFEGFSIEREDLRRVYGEPRFITTGEADGIIITVVWTPRGRNRRIITAWPASDKERRIYHEYRSIHERANPQT